MYISPCLLGYLILDRGFLLGEEKMKDTRCKHFLSRFLRVLWRDGLVAVYHQLHPEPVFLRDAKWVEFNRALESSASQSTAYELFSIFKDRKLLIADRENDNKELVNSRKVVEQALSRPTILYLMLAQGCNWACAGCPIPELAKRYGETLLSLEDAKYGIKLWQRHVADYHDDDQPFFIILYGGEPLLNQGLLAELLTYIDGERTQGNMPGNLELMLCTNGQLIDDEVIKLLRRYHVLVAIGMDGPGVSNDFSRKTREGDSTSKVITQAVKRMVKEEIRVVVSSTITPVNISSLSDFSLELQQLGVSGFGFNLLKGSALRHLNSDELQHYAQASAQLILRTGLNYEPSSFYEYQLEKRFQALTSSLPFAVDCTCYGNQLVIQPDGQVTNCPFRRHDQGHVSAVPEGFQITDTAVVKAWQKRLPIFSSAMEDDVCTTYLHGGGCAWSSYDLYGDENAVDVCNAIFTEEIQNGLIWLLLRVEQADALRRGEILYWDYRGVRPV